MSNPHRKTEKILPPNNKNNKNAPKPITTTTNSNRTTNQNGGDKESSSSSLNANSIHSIESTTNSSTSNSRDNKQLYNQYYHNPAAQQIATATGMKSKNNQSSFANNPTHSYSDQYYTNMGMAKTGAGGPRLSYGAAYADPYAAGYMGYPYYMGYPPALAPPLPPPPFPGMSLPPLRNHYGYPPALAASYHSPFVPYNYWQRPIIYDDKDPSLHDLLYLDNFRNKDASYTNKHVEKKVREIDGYWNPHVRYTLKDYKNFKATMGFGDGIGKNSKEYDPETKSEKRMKETGNFYMRSNVKPRRHDQMARSDPELPHINQVYNPNQEPHSLTPTATNHHHHHQQQQQQQNSMTSLNNNNNTNHNYNGYGSNTNNQAMPSNNNGYYGSQTNQLTSDLFLNDINGSNRNNPSHHHQHHNHNHQNHHSLGDDIFNDYQQQTTKTANEDADYFPNGVQNNMNHQQPQQQQINNHNNNKKLFKNSKFTFDSKGHVVKNS